MQELLIATFNPGKFHEITEILNGLSLKVLFLGDLKITDKDFTEDGKTFKENAYKKAKYFFDKTKIMTLAEDSGILVEALKDELGVKTRRWGAGEKASDQEWIDYFMKRMDGEKNKTAKFICSAYLIGDGIEKNFEGETDGVITEKIMAPLLPGLPLSSCFLPDGHDKVYAALTAVEKNEISHRGKAMKQIKNYLQSIII